MNFEEQVRQELKGLNQEEIVQFAWRCAVRALPILGHQGHFDFWKENKQRHLYSVFRAIDADAADAYADAAYAAYADAVRAARRLNIDLEPIILKDLQQIRAEGGGANIPIYLWYYMGEIPDSFAGGRL